MSPDHLMGICNSSITTQIKTQFHILSGLETKVNEIASTMVWKNDLLLPKPRYINWFSYDVGARAIDALCSPPAIFPHQTLQSPWYSSGNTPLNAKKRRVSILPSTALLPLDGIGGECYCGPAYRGKLQLVVFTPRLITPVELTIEHFKKSEVPRSGMAPKEVELWVQIAEEATRDAVRPEIERLYPGILKANSSQPNMFLAKEQALDDAWVPLGRWTYNILDQKKVQSFSSPLNLTNLRLASRRFAVRVNSNWGNVDFTCLARVYMQGIDSRGWPQYLE